jgi:hypothetical protein
MQLLSQAVKTPTVIQNGYPFWTNDISEKKKLNPTSNPTPNFSRITGDFVI